MSLVSTFDWVAAASRKIETIQEYDEIQRVSLDQFDDLAVYAKFKGDLKSSNRPKLIYITPPKATFDLLSSHRSFSNPHGDHLRPSISDANHWAWLAAKISNDVHRAGSDFAIEFEERSYFWFLPEIVFLFAIDKSFSCSLSRSQFSRSDCYSKDTEPIRILTTYLPLGDLCADTPWRPPQHGPFFNHLEKKRRAYEHRSAFEGLPAFRATITSLCVAARSDIVRTIVQCDSWIQTLKVESTNRKR